MLKMKIATAVSLFVASSAAASSPSIFIKREEGVAWWVAAREIRPIGAVVAGQSIEKINSVRSSKPAYEAFCYIEQQSGGSIVSSDRSTQGAIDQTLAEQGTGIFKLDFQPAPTSKYSAFVSAYEKCGGEVGSFVMVVNNSTNQIAEIGERADSLMFLYPLGNEKIGVTSCFECGDASTLHFDIRRNRFFWKYEGH